MRLSGKIVGAVLSMRNHLDKRVLRRAWTSEPSDRGSAFPRDLNVNDFHINRKMPAAWPLRPIGFIGIRLQFLLTESAGAAEPCEGADRTGSVSCNIVDCGGRQTCS